MAHYSTYYTNPVKPLPPENTRPPGMSDIEWQIRHWYNFNWLSGDSLVEQAVHNADKIMWVMHDQPPISAVAVGGRAVPANGGNIYDHFEVNYQFPNGYRVFLANRQATGCFNGTFYAQSDEQLETLCALIAQVNDNRYLAKLALFMFLARNARPPTEFFGIPPNDVVELGAQIEL